MAPPPPPLLAHCCALAIALLQGLAVAAAAAAAAELELPPHSSLPASLEVPDRSKGVIPRKYFNYVRPWREVFVQVLEVVALVVFIVLLIVLLIALLAGLVFALRRVLFAPAAGPFPRKATAKRSCEMGSLYHV